MPEKERSYQTRALVDPAANKLFTQDEITLPQATRPASCAVLAHCFDSSQPLYSSGSASALPSASSLRDAAAE